MLLRNLAALPGYFARSLHTTTALNMKVVGLISGGKDSCFNLLKCVAESHEIVALANLHPPEKTDELDSFMYQSVGHEMINAVAEALGLPLYRRALQGTSLNTDMYYEPRAGDEVEDLYELIKEVKEKHGVEGVAVGAVKSDYQRVRVENVCTRLGLTSLGYLWECNQMTLLQEMIDCKMDAILVKVACVGLDPHKHLNKTVESMSDYLTKLNSDYGVHVCGEGGEYETLTLDCPLYNSKIVIDECEVVEHTKSDISPVGYLKVSKYHLETKPAEVTSISWADRVKQLPIRDSDKFITNFLSSIPKSEVVPFVKKPAHQLSESWPADFESYQYSTDNEVFLSLQAHNTGDVAKDTGELMQRLGDILKWHSMTSANVSYALLYVSDMSQFANINAVYTKFYGINPPPRICVEAVMPKSSLFHAQILCSREPKDTRHVQGVSHWAPSCIGPYSQSAIVGSNVYVSGQVPLVPGSMKTLPSGFIGQCHLAFNHVMSVATAMGVSVDQMVSAHCYMIREEDVEAAVSFSKEKLPSQVQPMFVLVPRLPRDVMVEWHINFNKTAASLTTKCVASDDLSEVCDHVTRGLSNDGHFFMFYSAPTVDTEQLLKLMRNLRSNSTFIPVPVTKVVSDESQLQKKYQVMCVQVVGLSI